MTRLRTREGKLSFLLLMLMLLSITWSMEFANWAEGLYVVEWTVLGGLILGFLMTRLGWPRVWSHVVSAVVGASIALAVVGRFVAPSVGWRDGIGVVAYHFDSWLRMVSSTRSATGAVTFVLLVSLLGWWAAYVCAWMVFGSHRVWQAVALSGGAMLLVAYGSPPEAAPFFVLYLFCALLLAVRLYVYTRQESWERRSARYDRDIVLSFLRDGGLLVLTVVLVVWTAPLLSSSEALGSLWLRLEGPWRAMGDEWSRLFSGVLGYPRGYENVPFGQELALGGPIDLGQETVMWVTTDEGRYWRGMVYDHYTGRGWESADDETLVVPARRDLPAEGLYESQGLVEQTVVLSRPGIGQVFQFGQPIAISLPTEIRYSLLEPGAGGTADPWAGTASVSLVKTRVPVSVDRPYTVFSWTSTADAASLREAGRDHPQWISSRYLQLPQSLPDRVRELAEGVTYGYDNDYDKAVAIRDYLRRTVVYREDIEAPPEDRDPIDYLLFDSRAGYCNYYASAMVVMARSVGIPARLAVGYVGGELDPDREWYEIRQRDTHAWVEVYFPTYGWIEFEPTANVAPIQRPEGGQDEVGRAAVGDTGSRLERDLERFRDEEMDLGEVVVPGFRSGRSPSAWPFVVAAACLGIAAGAYWCARSLRPGSTSEIGKVYRRMCTYARLLGVTGRIDQTPNEYAFLVAERLPGSASQVGQIAELFVRDQFGRETMSPADERAARQAWTKLRPPMLRALLRRLPDWVRSAVSLDWRRRRR